MSDTDHDKALLRAYGTLLRQAKIMVDDYEHLAPDADSRIDPLRKRRIVKMRKSIQRVKSLKVESRTDRKHSNAEMLTAFEDILLTIGDAQTESDHRVKMIAERAIAKARGR